jgi:glycosyltransferase involved in cell wall biosynthesis
MRARPEWHYHLLFDKYEPGSPVDKLLMHPNVSHADFDDRDRPLARMHHITDPLGLLTGVDSPFRIAPNLPLSVVFFDLIPMVLKQYFSDQWPAHHKSAYITRLQQLVNSQAAILAISENTKQDLNRLLNVPLERVSTIMAGLNREVREERPSEASVRSTLGKFGLRQPFFMTVGGLDPHKGFGDTGKAFLIARQNEQVMLAVVGSEDDPYKGMYRKVFEQHGSAGVVFTGFVSREELECLYAAASGLIFPSRYEGFGLPVIEAMAAGCPVITTNAASLPEVAGDAAIMVNPGDAEGIAQAITRLIHSDGLRNDLIAKGYERARLFTWEKTAQVTVRVWERLMNLQGAVPASKSSRKYAASSVRPLRPALLYTPCACWRTVRSLVPRNPLISFRLRPFRSSLAISASDWVRPQLTSCVSMAFESPSICEAAVCLQCSALLWARCKSLFRLWFSRLMPAARRLTRTSAEIAEITTAISTPRWNGSGCPR